MSPVVRATALLALAAVLAGCRIDAPGVSADAPDGYHRMPDGTLMADVAMETEYRALSDSGVLVATHTRPDGTVVLGSPPDHASGDHGGHDHPLPDPDDFPQGITPVRLVVPRISLDATVVAASMDAGRIEGPPVAGDVAWLEQTRRPGEIGPAVIGGVTALDGRAGAYADLAALAPGDEFVVFGSEQEAIGFRVTEVVTSPVTERAEVFRAGAGHPQLRLVAWGLDDDRTDLVVHAAIIDPDIPGRTEP